MKRVVYHQFGGPDVLEIVKTEIPAIQSHQVLVRVKAVSINPLDWKVREGSMQIVVGKKFPKYVGIDFSGSIEAIGADVNEFQVGDAVFGGLSAFTGGALAEYIAVEPNQIALKPANISFEQAATLAATGTPAIKAMEEMTTIGRGSDVLINGATGGVGMFATQIAKRQGATVTAVTSTGGLAAAQDWGSDYVLDYKHDDVLKVDRQYDVIFDLSEKLPFNKAKPIMKKQSIHIAPVPDPKTILLGSLNNVFSGKKSTVLNAPINKSYLEKLAQYAANGLDIRISRSYTLSDVQEAYTEVPKGSFVGKVIFEL